MREHIEWNVETHMRCAIGPTSSATRDFISPAALLVNVIAASPNGDARCSAIRYAIRCVSTRVLPEPAPAMTMIGPSGADAASRWTGLRPSSTASAEITPASYACSVARRRCSVARRVGLQLELLGGLGLLAPRPQQPRVVGVQRDGERAGGVDLQPEVRLPLAVERDRRRIDSARQTAEPHPLGVEHPGAVGGVDASHRDPAYPSREPLRPREVLSWPLSPCRACRNPSGRRC